MHRDPRVLTCVHGAGRWRGERGGAAPRARHLPPPSGPAPLSPPARVSWCRLRDRLIIDRLGCPRLCQQVAPLRPGAARGPNLRAAHPQGGQVPVEIFGRAWPSWRRWEEGSHRAALGKGRATHANAQRSRGTREVDRTAGHLRRRGSRGIRVARSQLMPVEGMRERKSPFNSTGKTHQWKLNFVGLWKWFKQKQNYVHKIPPAKYLGRTKGKPASLQGPAWHTSAGRSPSASLVKQRSGCTPVLP